MSDVASGRSSALAGALLFGGIVLFIAWDLAADYQSGTDWPHLTAESLVLLFAGVGALVLWRRFLRVRSEALVLERDLEAAQGEARRWREESRELLAGLGEAIERQFRRWRLTPAEAEIGCLLLKGLSHKEIAGIRNTSERTVRQQARALYVKAGLSGRSELSAFFLEDLLQPASTRIASPTPTGAPPS